MAKRAPKVKEGNPFVLDGRPLDTIHHARCAVLFVREATDAALQPNRSGLSEDESFGLFLILEGIANALEVAQEQVNDEK